MTKERSSTMFADVDIFRKRMYFEITAPVGTFEWYATVTPCRLRAIIAYFLCCLYRRSTYT